MKPEIVKELTTNEIKEKIIDERDNFTKLKLSHAVSPIENPMVIRETRRFIARLETEYKERMMKEEAKPKAE